MSWPIITTFFCLLRIERDRHRARATDFTVSEHIELAISNRDMLLGNAHWFMKWLGTRAHTATIYVTTPMSRGRNRRSMHGEAMSVCRSQFSFNLFANYIYFIRHTAHIEVHTVSGGCRFLYFGIDSVENGKRKQIMALATSSVCFRSYSFVCTLQSSCWKWCKEYHNMRHTVPCHKNGLVDHLRFTSTHSQSRAAHINQFIFLTLSESLSMPSDIQCTVWR